MEKHEIITHTFIWVQSGEIGKETWAFLIKWLPTILIGLFSAMISVVFQFKRGKIATKSGAIFATILSFALSMLATGVWNSTFGTEYGAAIAAGTALFGKEVLMWIFTNWDDILTGITKKAGIKVNRRKP